MRKHLLKTLVSAAFVAGLLATAAPANAAEFTATTPSVGGCSRSVTVGWNYPGTPPYVYTSGQISC